MAKREATEAKNVPLRTDGKVNQVELLKLALTLPGSLSNTFNRFYKYSLSNMFLVYLQTGKAEPMGTFKKWESLGRKVISGPGSGLFVNHPRFAPLKDDKGKVVLNPKTGKPEMKMIGSYLRPTVFQLWQTEGPELKMPEVPSWDYEMALKVLGIQEVPFTQQDGNIAGYSLTTTTGEHHLALNPVNAGEPLTTALHEIAHIVLGHTAPDYPYATHYHRSVAEFQAEAVAYLLMHELEVPFNASESRGYIQNWLRGNESEWLAWSDTEADNLELLQDKTVRQIFSAADKILVAGRKKHFDSLIEG